MRSLFAFETAVIRQVGLQKVNEQSFVEPSGDNLLWSFTGSPLAGCMSRLHKENTMLSTKSHHNENLNNNRVGKHPGIVFGYETISPIVSGRKQLKSRSVGYAREKRFPTFQHRHT